MAHVKQAGGSKVSQGGNVAGKRRGVKIYGGQFAKAGSIIVRQKGTTFFPGKNTDMGRDFTIFAKIEGTVSFRNLTGIKTGRKIIDIIPL